MDVYPLVSWELLFVVETFSSLGNPVVSSIADLIAMYKQLLEKFGSHTTESEIHSTRLWDKLLLEIQELEAHNIGRDILLAISTDVGSALSEAQIILNYSTR